MCLLLRVVPDKDLKRN